MKQFLKQNLIKLLRRFGETNPIIVDWREIEDLEAASHLLNTMRAARFLEPKVIEAPKNQRVLIFAPHPDDEIIGPGGTLVQMLENGCTVKVVVFSNDGTEEVSCEIKAVADAAGYEVEELNFRVRNIPSDPEQLKRVPEIFEEFKPEALFLTFMLDDHPDHRQISEIVMNTLKTSAFDHIDDWAYQVYTCLPMNAVVNIGKTIDRKMNLLQIYQSRFRNNRDWCHWTRGLNAFNVRFLPQGQSNDYAEVFYKVPLKTYLAMSKFYFKGQK